MSVWKVHVIHLSNQQQRHFWPTEAKAWRNLSRRVTFMGVWDIRLAPAGVGKVFALTELHHPLQTHFVRGCPQYTHKYYGGQKLLHPFSSLGKAPLTEVIGSEQTDQKNLIPAPLWLMSPHIKPTWACYQAQVTQENKYSLNWFVSHPSLCLSSQILSIKCWKCFLVDELVVLNPVIALIWLFWVFDKINRRVS